jgi:hypothetical protein
MQLGVIRIFEPDPDKAVWPADVVVNLADGNVGKLPAILIRDTVDQHNFTDGSNRSTSSIRSNRKNRK